MISNLGSRFACIVALGAITLGCNSNGNHANTVSASSDTGKLPITTKSEQARAEFLQGRDLSERLLGQDSLAHFDKAIELDPEFALAEQARATNSPTPNEFFEHQKKAVALADKASEGERFFIAMNDAAANGDVTTQKENLDKLVAAFPNDERVLFAMGNYYFGQQDYTHTIECDKKATEVAPNYSPAYNILGYSYKQTGDYANAEQALQKYVALIPNDPNPYDSYAELLLKEGKFEESVAQYRKALQIDSNFNPSRFGLSADLTYMGKPSDAQFELEMMARHARNDGELRTALFGLAVVAADAGKFDEAEQSMDKEYAVAEKKNDAPSMAADLQAKGNIAVAAQRYDVAKQHFDHSLQLIQSSSLSQKIKDNATLVHHFNMAVIALGKNNLTTAKAESEEFRKGAEAKNNANQLRQAHELAGRIALAQKDYDQAIAELQQANNQNPQNLYRLGEAYRAKGDASEAQSYFEHAASFNSLPQLNYAFIRVKAQKTAAKKS